ncbi:hypothetical protein CNMCM5878_003393 [Aspergillus fumigatiaffinis]|nr:hypothetical protein CNMCM5878_003393 [Aspergillus fumigatiaffinis]
MSYVQNFADNFRDTQGDRPDEEVPEWMTGSFHHRRPLSYHRLRFDFHDIRQLRAVIDITPRQRDIPPQQRDIRIGRIDITPQWTCMSAQPVWFEVDVLFTRTVLSPSIRTNNQAREVLEPLYMKGPRTLATTNWEFAELCQPEVDSSIASLQFRRIYCTGQQSVGRFDSSPFKCEINQMRHNDQRIYVVVRAYNFYAQDIRFKGFMTCSVHPEINGRAGRPVGGQGDGQDGD